MLCLKISMREWECNERPVPHLQSFQTVDCQNISELVWQICHFPFPMHGCYLIINTRGSGLSQQEGRKVSVGSDGSRLEKSPERSRHVRPFKVVPEDKMS